MAINKDFANSKSTRGKNLKAHLLREARQLNKELAHTYRHLTKAEIEAQYTPERIEALLKRGRQNLKDMQQIIPTEQFAR